MPYKFRKNSTCSSTMESAALAGFDSNCSDYNGVVAQ